MPGRRDHLLTFDCYGTLIDWEGGITTAFTREAAVGDRVIDPDRLLAAYAACEAEVEAGPYLPYREVLARAALCAADRLGWALPHARAGFLAASLPAWEPFPDTNPALRRLAERFAMGILSNVDDDLLGATRRRLEVAWDLIVTAEQVRSYKPRYAHWEETRRRTEGRYRAWTHVAQSYYHDVVPAFELGIPVVWVNRRAERVGPERPAPTREAASLEQAAAALLEDA